MNKKELSFIIQEGEGLKTEFKSSLDKTLAKEMVAFANAVGGRIFLGIDDSGEIKGISLTNHMKSQIQDIANNCEPSIEIRLEKFENILIVNVEEGKNKPCKCKEGFFMRIGPNSQKMSRDQIIGLAIDEGRIRFDEQINNEFNFPADFDSHKFDEFLKKSSISRIGSVKQVLTNLFLGKYVKNKFKLNNAGVLLFGKNPEKFFRQNFITCVLYKGKEKVDIIDRKDFKNDLFTNYENGIAFLKQHLNLEYLIKGTGARKEILELPEEALRESLLNAIIHRDYFEDRFGVFVEMFDDRVELTNKGKLLFDKQELGKISMPRNPLLFDMFHRMGLIEKVGSGINRIKKQMRERSLKVEFETDSFFRIVFHRAGGASKTSEKSDQKNVENVVQTWSKRGVNVGETEEKILQQVIINPRVRLALISQVLKLPQRTVEDAIARLKSKGIIKRIGPDKGGHWEIITQR